MEGRELRAPRGLQPRRAADRRRAAADRGRRARSRAGGDHAGTSALPERLHKLLTAPEGDEGLDAPRADNGRTWLDMPQVSLLGSRITLRDGRRVQEAAHWPTPAERIEIDTEWNMNGVTSFRTLTTDLAFGRTDISNPRFAYPFVIKRSTLTSHTRERLILVAYSGADHYEPDAEELAQHRATAKAAADITVHGLDGWLTAVNRLVEERLVCCLQADARPSDGIRILLHDEAAVPIKTERYGRKDPLRRAIETDPGPARKRNNRLRYEGGPFERPPRNPARYAGDAALEAVADAGRNVRRGARPTALGAREPDPRPGDGTRPDTERHGRGRGNRERPIRRRLGLRDSPAAEQDPAEPHGDDRRRLGPAGPRHRPRALRSGARRTSQAGARAAPASRRRPRSRTRGTRRGARPPGAGAAGRVRGATEHEARGRVAGEPRTPRMCSGAPAKATGSSMAPPGPRYRAGPQTKRGARAAGDSNDEEIMKHAKKHADDLIEMLTTAIEAQSAPWQKPWKCDARLPTNLITGKVYTGRNLLMLATVRALKAYDDHRWAGFQQIKSAGGHVRRGERGHWICIMRSVGAARAAGQNDVDLDQESDGSLSGPGRRRTTRGYTYTTFRPVWNASQCENIAPLEEAEATDEGKRRRILAGEAYLAGTPARVDIRRRNDACYRSRSDEVLLPRREQFDEPVGFYQTALHELAHATEHESRLDRHLDENRFGSAQYIREELVAKVAAFLATTNADLGHSPGVLLLGIRKPDGSGCSTRTTRGRSEVLPIYIVGLGGRPRTFTAIIALTAIPATGLRVPRPHGDARVRRPVRHPNGRGTESGSAPDERKHAPPPVSGLDRAEPTVEPKPSTLPAQTPTLYTARG